MLEFENLAEVRSAIDQIDQLIAGLQAQREHCLRAVTRFAPPPASGAAFSAAQAEVAAAQAQCAPCSGPA